MNNKKNTRRGFTIVELVIVIAVIAILAAVLVPTFGSIIKNAQISAAEQEAKNIYTSYVAEDAESDEGLVSECWVKTSNGYYVCLKDGGVVDGKTTKEESELPAEYTLLTHDGTAEGDVYGTRAVTTTASTPATPAE